MVSKELENFAIDFSEKYLELSVGDYYSKNKTYHIKYLDKIALSKGFRKNNKTGTIEIDKAFCETTTLTPDFIYYYIIWCALINSSDYIKADAQALQHYLTTTRSRKAIMAGHLELFKDKLTPMNEERLRRVQEILIG